MFESLKPFSFRQTGALLLYLFAIVTLGSFIVGPMSLRVYSTVIMLIYLILNIHRFNSVNIIPISSAYIKLYLSFLFVFFICLCLTGDLISVGFFRRLLAYDLVCIVTFFAIYLNVNSHTQLRQVAIFLLLICMFDAIVTVLQMTGNELGWVIGRFIAPFDNAKDIAERNTDIVGVSIAPGIFGNVVSNAFKLTSFSTLAIAFFNKKEKGWLFFLMVFNVVALVAIFLTQQRAAFYLFLFSWIVYLFIRIMRKPILLFFLLITISLIAIKLEGVFSDFDFGRLISVQDDSRSYLAQYALKFIPEHFLLGGFAEFTKATGLTTHNIFFDSLIFAGVGGFITLMTFDLKIGLTCVRHILFFMKGKCSQMTFALAMAMFSCTMYGFTHNTSVLTGDVVVFILLALLLKSIKIDRIHKSI